MGELYNPYPKLPKNIRQIGERDQIIKLYVEDYVNTYLKRLYPLSGQDLRAGLLLGNTETHDGTPYLFIDGAVEMEGVTEEGEKVVFTEQAWKKAYQTVEQMFPKRTVQGWFLCGAPGCQLSPLNYWKEHVQYFQGPHKLMYLNSGMEGEESVYITSEDGFYKLRGHCIYYERNQMMQDYMVMRKDARRVESGVSDNAVKDFRRKMESHKETAVKTSHTVSVLGGLCSVMAIVILAGGIAMFNNYGRMREMESVITSVLPAGVESVFGGKNSGKTKTAEAENGKKESHVIVEEIDGGLEPSFSAEGETLAEVSGSQAAQAESGETGVPGAAADFGTPAESKAEDSGQREVFDSTGAGEVYIVQEGETLYGICLKFYHDINRLPEICELNGLEDENKIDSGQKLLLP